MTREEIFGDEKKKNLKGFAYKNNYITGSSISEKITGGKLDDTLFGGMGNDSIYGGNGNDLIRGGLGFDKLYGGSGDDLIYGEDGDDLIKGDSGNDTLYGGKGNDKLYGVKGYNKFVFTKGDGNDTIYAGKGIDTIEFTNIDTSKIKLISTDAKNLVLKYSDNDSVFINKYYSKSSLENVVINGQTYSWDSFLKQYPITIIASGTVKGTKYNDRIEADSGDDKISAGKGNDLVYCNDGNDTIKGGDGNDTIYAGKGNDLIYGDKGDDMFVFTRGDGNDTIISGGGEDTIKLENVGGDINFYQGNDKNAKDLIIKYNKERESIIVKNFFKIQNGLLVGINSSVKKLIVGDITYDIESILRDSGSVAVNMKIIGTYIPETLIGAAYDDTIYGVGGNNLIFGEGGNDSIFGGIGNDNIWAGDNDDFINGVSGNNTLNGGDGDDYIIGGIGNDRIHGEEGNDTIYGYSGNNTIIGGEGNDFLYAGKGSDLFKFDTGSGDDIIIGASGNDSIEFVGEVDRLSYFLSRNDLIISATCGDITDSVIIANYFLAIDRIDSIEIDNEKYSILEGIKSALNEKSNYADTNDVSDLKGQVAGWVTSEGDFSTADILETSNENQFLELRTFVLNDEY